MNLDKGPALSPRLQAMLEKKRLVNMTGRLEKKLAKVQETRKAETLPPKDDKLSEELLHKTDKPQEKRNE